jgi:hypothetical protein
MTLAARTSRWPSVRTPARKRRDPPEIGATGEVDRQTEQDDPTQQTEGQTQGQPSALASAGDRATNPQPPISLRQAGQIVGTHDALGIGRRQPGAGN